MDLKLQLFMKKEIIFLPLLSSSNPKNISKLLAGIQISHIKNLVDGKYKEEKASSSNYKRTNLSIN
jgi:hypothetical protein